MLSSVAAWPVFAMNKPLQAQLLRLEDAYEKISRAGSALGDEVKIAILLRCVTGALKTHPSFNLKENSKYNEVREEVLLWDRAHQKWSNLVQPQEDSGGGAGNHSDPVHMEIDRTKVKSGKFGKGKSNKGSSKGKQKGEKKNNVRSSCKRALHEALFP